MRHQEKLDHFDKLLDERGFSRVNARPPVFLLLWKLGIPVPPPYFLTFRQTLLGVGGAFSLAVFLVLAAGALWLVDGAPELLPLLFVASLAMVVGLLFGLCMAFWWGLQRDKLELPRWSDYPLADERDRRAS